MNNNKVQTLELLVIYGKTDSMLKAEMFQKTSRKALTQTAPRSGAA